MKKNKSRVLPFKAYIYNSESVDIKDVVSPPYDVIDAALQDVLYKKSDFNIIRLEFGKEFDDDNGGNRYSRAALFFQDWIKKGVLKRDKTDSIYIYVQKFDIDNITYERFGFISLFSLNAPDEKDAGGIYGHETTLSKPKEDRFKLIDAARANFSPVFSVFEDDDLSVLTALTDSIKKDIAPKIFDFKDENGITNTLYRLSDVNEIGYIRDRMEAKYVYIADGHHRFETCVNFRNHVKKAGINGVNADACMMYLAPANQKGLIILPTHRCVINKAIDIGAFINEIKKDFDVCEVDLNELTERTGQAGEKGCAFGFAHKSGRNYVLSVRNADAAKNNPLESLDVSILERRVFKKVLKISEDDIKNQRYLTYEKDADNALKKLNSGLVEAVFFMNSTKIEDVIKTASMNLRMPQKSTFFYPKIITGLTVNSLTADISDK